MKPALVALLFIGCTTASVKSRDNATTLQLESCGDLPGRPRGDITTYSPTPDFPGRANCDLDWRTVVKFSRAWHYFAALPRVGAESYNQGMACGACVKVRCSCNQDQFKEACKNPDAEEEVIAMITDACPYCKAGDISLSNAAWYALQGEASFYSFQGTWEFVECPNEFVNATEDGSPMIRFKEGSSKHWFGIQPINFHYSITSVKVNGQELTGRTGFQDFWFIGQNASLPAHVEVQSWGGHTASGTVKDIGDGAGAYAFLNGYL